MACRRRLRLSPFPARQRQALWLPDIADQTAGLARFRPATMSCMDPVKDARALVGERFAGAPAAFLGGSVLSPLRTATSDLDIVIILAGPPAPYRESMRWRGWPVETFVHDAASLEHFFAKDAARRRPTLARMCSDGVILAGWQRAWSPPSATRPR
jgi:hypothetical protein